MIDYSLIVPIYKNEDNISSLFIALRKIDLKLDYRCEFIFVIDGSPDRSEQLINEIRHEFVRNSSVISLSKNYGSFTAIRAGLEEAKGKYIAVMAADLQEPPSLILDFFEGLENDCYDVVFGQRMSRKDPPMKSLLSNVYWSLYRKIVEPDMPKGGVDIFGCNKKVRDSVIAIEEINSSLVAQLFWVGFRRGFIPYERLERVEGKSAWSFKKRFKYMLDSIFSYTDFPIILLLSLGFIGLVLSIFYIFIIFIAYALGDIEQPGFASQSLLITVFGCSVLFSQGILGCYIWRILENSKKRPLYFKKDKED
ncbi:glycosyltransferase family 2 protein [Vibrio palustris]|uniref:Putative glycosyltransferase CsbB n=1 Tax=Vibrio palustris TaxID=1918946 RepID=A0A1R4B3Q4_9VIBR|nr:glycosyltransferase family 2 protein [Vibrio palustris]SJL83535.1 Putative glycosyltransferase CsbB [Vibrio palustris]